MIYNALLSILLFNPSNLTLIDNGYNASSDMELRFRLPILECDIDTAYLEFYCPTTILYNNTSSYLFDFNLPVSEYEQNLVYFHTNVDDEYGMYFEFYQRIGEGPIPIYYGDSLHYDLLFTFDDDEYCNIFFYNGSTYATSSHGFWIRGLINHDWYDEVIYDEYYDTKSIAYSGSFYFSSDPTIRENLSQQIIYQLNYVNLGDNSSYSQGYEEGYNNGLSEGYTEGHQEGYDYGHSVGFTEGYEEGSEQDQTVQAIYSGIIAVGLIPINFFLQIFNFEILGINVAEILTSLFTSCIAIIVVKHAFAIKDD